MRRGGRVDPATIALVDRQMRNWELARSQRLSIPVPERPEVEDFVCVSRMVGVGDAVARLLAERLGWPLFDKEILAAMAGDDRRLKVVYASMDERDVGWWQEVFNPLIRDGLARNDYFHQLCKTALSLARQSSGVFVGRGLDRVLPADLGFRVQLVASLDERVRRFAAEHGVDHDAARRDIARIESERATFLRRHYGVEAADATRFDLTLRVDRLSAESAVAVLLGARDQLSGDQAPVSTSAGTG